jgi:hypothetical protein
VVDRESNRRVSKNHIGGVKVSRIAHDLPHSILLSFTPPR